MTEPRAYTAKETLDMYDAAFRDAARYWARQSDLSPEDRCDGVRFSIMSILDGCGFLPSLTLSVSPHPDDKAYHIECGENWFEPGQIVNANENLHDRPKP